MHSWARDACRRDTEEHPADLIYGASYVDLEYALPFHSLILERGETVESVAFARARDFMRQSGDRHEDDGLARERVTALLHDRIDAPDIDQVKEEVAPFVPDRCASDGSIRQSRTRVVDVASTTLCLATRQLA